MRPSIRLLLTALCAVFLVALLADGADAQRRRRRRHRRRHRRHRTEQVQEQPPEEATEAAPPAAPPADAGAQAPAEAEATPEAAPEPAPTPEPEAEAEPATPAEPSTEPAPAYDPGPAPPDVTPIRADYVTLMDDLVQARMRVSALGSELFRTRIEIELQDRTGGETSLARLSVHLDGAPVFQSDGPVEGADSGRSIFEGTLAPGPHVMTVEVEQRAREDDAYRYTLQDSFRFQVVRERLSDVTLILEDNSDMAQSFPSGGEGRYEVRTRLRVAARALPSN